jgi:hypothetical protein
VKGLRIQRNEHVTLRLHDLTEISLARTEDSWCDLVRGEILNTDCWNMIKCHYYTEWLGRLTVKRPAKKCYDDENWIKLANY